ncbi:hypothetical protein N7G274_006176 [Stereocaulon virgatum]|uniref:Uncharacterized protein n=1 Tax=Stereocaulon virgatum TaxID=373712 RepID=A0ABR4A773_9LECA
MFDPDPFAHQEPSPRHRSAMGCHNTDDCCPSDRPLGFSDQIFVNNPPSGAETCTLFPGTALLATETSFGEARWQERTRETKNRGQSFFQGLVLKLAKRVIARPGNSILPLPASLSGI